MRTLSFLLLSAFACSRAEPTESLTPRSLVVHEWGTYTSLQGSDGRSMDGLHHAEHTLPEFVFARDPLVPLTKGVGTLPEPVNQKLETPVLYFYGEAGPTRVAVRFPEGIISEWYPDAASFSPPLEPLAHMSGGEMRWNAELIDPAGLDPIAVPDDSIWAPSRRVQSLGVKAGDQQEHFIFYRGLGRFERPIRATSDDETVTLTNDSEQSIAAAFLLNVTDGAGAITALGTIGAHGSATATPGVPIARYLAEAKAIVAAALEQSGLYPDEAKAMVDTWEQSYFLAPGTRILYLAPRAWTDALLPIQIEPAPTALVRTLVGRIEVMTRVEERRIVAEVQAAMIGRGLITPDSYGRFTEPKLRRAAELLDDPEAKSWAQSFADSLVSAP